MRLKLATDSTTLTVADPSVGQRVLLELPTVATAVLVLVGIYWLFQVARTLSAGEAFRIGVRLRDDTEGLV